MQRCPDTATLHGTPKQHSLRPQCVFNPNQLPPWVALPDLKGVRFLVRYWLAVCISHGSFSRYQVTEAVHQMLRNSVVREAEAVAVRRHVHMMMMVMVCGHQCQFSTRSLALP